jgi:hypothetical protein
MPKRQRQGRAYIEDDATSDAIPGPGQNADMPDIKREVQISPMLDDALREAVRLLSRATGSNPSNSHLIRALLMAVAHAMPEIQQESQKIGRLERPSNVQTSREARELYERKLAVALVAAIKSAPPLLADETSRRKPGDTRRRSA